MRFNLFHRIACAFAAVALGAAVLLPLAAQAVEPVAAPAGVTRFTSGANFAANQNSWGRVNGHDLAWSTSRFGLTMDFGTPVTRAEDANDLSAGAYFRITPSLRLGGQLKLGTTGSSATRAAQPDEREPRVRFETAFQF